MVAFVLSGRVPSIAFSFLFALLPRALYSVPCPPNEPVIAFFAGQVDLGAAGVEPCKPDMEQCHFPGRISTGPDAEGNYMIDWDDGDLSNRKVHHMKVKQSSSGEACAGPSPAPPAEDDDNWVPPEIPCTILPRLHWEGSDPEWNKEAVAALKNEYKPDEVIDGFDWHVILRFNDADRCEATYKSLDTTLSKCKETDPEKCRTHKYVKAIEYVGDDPETRRKTGRRIHHNTNEHDRTEL